MLVRYFAKISQAWHGIILRYISTILLYGILLGAASLAAPPAVASPITIYDFNNNIDFMIELYQIDDQAVATLSNNSDSTENIANQGFGPGPYFFDFTSYVKPSYNDLQINLYNYIAGYTIGWSILANSSPIAGFSCGIFNTYGCDNNSYQTGLVYSQVVSLNIINSIPEPKTIWIFCAATLVILVLHQRWRAGSA